MDTNIFSYKFIQNSIRNFRRLRGDDFNLYDEPGTYWFKPIFYFYRSTIESESADINNEGLLHPSWLKDAVGDGVISNNVQGTAGEKERKDIVKNKFVSSAYNYLMRNDETARANLLKQFITILSNISSRSPWYFQEVGGLDTAVDNSESFKEGKFINDTRKQITFTLLPDAVDDRIGTLIDLYRSVCYSWKEKKEIVPANLRKFDMGLYVFGSMIQDDHSNDLFSKAALNGTLDVADQLGVGYTPDTEIVNASGNYVYEADKPRGRAHLYLEFHNCEIDLSSTKGGDTISNAEGSERKYTLTINYDDCYVNRYNDFILGSIGDIIRTDIESSIYGKSIDRTIGRSEGGFANKIMGRLEGATVGQAKQAISSVLGRTLLGNLYHFSLTDTVRDTVSGHIISTGTNELNKLLTSRSVGKGNASSLYPEPKTNLNEIEPGGSIYKPTPEKKTIVKTLGNLYKGVGLMRNI